MQTVDGVAGGGTELGAREEREEQGWEVRDEGGLERVL